MELLNSIPESFKEEDTSDSHKFCLNEAIIFILKMLSPIAPHICEYLWREYQYDSQNVDSWWPEYNEDLLDLEEFELIVQVNGKVRGKIILEKGVSQNEIEKIASQIENVSTHIGGSNIKKSIYVKDKLINFVI